MKTALEVICGMAFIGLLLTPMAIFAKDEKRVVAAKEARRIDRDGNKLVEKIEDRGRSKGTNIVYRTGRTFPLMFSKPVEKTQKHTAKPK